MTEVTITFEGGSYNQKTIELSSSAREAVRISFNPSGDMAVLSLKALAAAFITMCEAIENDKASTIKQASSREFAVAKTSMQTASMWAVLGATKGL